MNYADACNASSCRYYAAASKIFQQSTRRARTRSGFSRIMARATYQDCLGNIFSWSVSSTYSQRRTTRRPTGSWSATTTLKRDVNQLPYDVPRELEVAIGRFIDFYNYRRYHKALRDITPADMLVGRRDAILGRRGEVKDRTINRRKLSNHVLREQLTTA